MNRTLFRHAALALVAALSIARSAGADPPGAAHASPSADGGGAAREVDPTLAQGLAPMAYVALERVLPSLGVAPARPTLLDPVAYEHGGHCRDRLARSTSGAPPDCPASALVYLHAVDLPGVIVVPAGGRARQLTSVAAVVQAFGAIDSPEKAALIAWVGHYEFGPPVERPPLPRVRATDDGFVVEARRTSYTEGGRANTWIDVYEVELMVRRDGTSIEQNARRVSHTRGRSAPAPTF